MTQKEKRQAPSPFDSMSSEQLQEILRKHTNGELEPDPDTQDLFEIMEVLSERRQQQPSQAFRSDEKAFAEFLQYYMPKEQEHHPQGKVAKTPAHLLKTVAAVLAVVMLLTVGTTLTAKAFRFNIWKSFATWTADFFEFVVITDPKGKAPEKSPPVEIRDLQEAMMIFGVNEKIVPTRLPEGYTQKEIDTESHIDWIRIDAFYGNGDEELLLSIRRLFQSPPMHIPKNGEEDEIYTVRGVDYYILFTAEGAKLVWVADGCECVITGKLTMAEIKAMIDSIEY